MQEHLITSAKFFQSVLTDKPETFNCTIWILVLLYISEHSWEKIASDKKSAEIRRNPQKYPIKYPKQIPQANTPINTQKYRFCWGVSCK